MKLLAFSGYFLLLVSLTCAQNCPDVSKADVYLLLDIPYSMKIVEFIRLKEFISNMVERFPSGQNGTRFGYGVTGTAFAHIENLTDYKHIYQSVFGDGAEYKELSLTDFALDEINRMGYLTSPTHGKRPDAQKLLLVIINGNPMDAAKTKAAAKKLRDQGVQIFSIASGSADEDILLGIAGRADNVFRFNDPGFLDRISNRIFCRVDCQSDFDYHTDPEDCSKFYRCSQGQPVSFSCGPGTMWAQETKACDYAHKVNCGYRPRSG